MSNPQETGFRNRAVSGSTLEDLILLELAGREQMQLDENRQPRSASGISGGLRARDIALHEGWQVAPTEVDRACAELVRGRYLVPVPEDPGADLASGAMVLSRGGLSRAAELAPSYLRGPITSWAPIDPAFADMGQIDVNFLGSRFVIGCVEGEESKSKRLVERFEIDAGEVTKAVSDDIDDVRAMLMAGVLAYERLEEFEDAAAKVPASDRLVGLDHNSPQYAAATHSLDALIIVVRSSNHYRESDAADQERRLAELEAGRALLRSRWVSLPTVKAALWGTLAYLAAKFADAPIGEAASLAWAAVKRMLGIG